MPLKQQIKNKSSKHPPHDVASVQNLPAAPWLHQKTLPAENSKVNTPPNWAIFFAGLVFDWILAEGCQEEMGKRNLSKARILHDSIDASGLYRCPAAEKCRSSVSVLFDLPSKMLEATFLEEATRSGLLNPTGHFASGGIRACLYNAVTEEAVRALTGFMDEFAAGNRHQVELQHSTRKLL